MGTLRQINPNRTRTLLSTAPRHPYTWTQTRRIPGSTMLVPHGEAEKGQQQKKVPGIRASRAVYGEYCRTSGGRRYVLGVLILMAGTIIRMMEGKLDARIHLNDPLKRSVVIMVEYACTTILSYIYSTARVWLG
jgi:hypothetical protein